ncbi:hypothetical protein SPD48_14085 [Pseudogracilibacillus sp. SE30717A]|uniref:hypothetical protein n=1 Tax=Pseudogracilibacillus sp. SE30717A TaxID=3098293 RepID=UPI00300E4A25
MSLTKKICLYTFIILLIVSLYNDIKKETNITNNSSSLPLYVDNGFKSIKIKTTTGDTILSVTEHINGEVLNDMTMENILDDFNNLNPNVNSLELTPGEYYYFPVYKDLVQN